MSANMKRRGSELMSDSGRQKRVASGKEALGRVASSRQGFAAVMHGGVLAGEQLQRLTSRLLVKLATVIYLLFSDTNSPLPSGGEAEVTRTGQGW